VAVWIRGVSVTDKMSKKGSQTKMEKVTGVTKGGQRS